MAEIVKQNPYSSEIQSPLIAGLSEGLNKISAILNLETGEFVDMPIEAVSIDTTEENKYRIYEMPFGQKLWLKQPRPIIKRNGAEITPDKIPFTIDYIGGSVTFEKPLNPLDPSTPPISENDSITVSATYIKGNSTTLNAITNLLAQVEQKADRYKGYFATVDDLQLSFQEGTNGDIAFVEKPQFALYSWDSTQTKWRNTQSIEDLSKYYTKVEMDGFLQGKEPSITPNGKTNFYYSGDKSWQDVNQATRATKLDGLVYSNKEAVKPNDNVLTAIGKLQAQHTETAKMTFIQGTGEPTTATVGLVGQRYVNTSTNDEYICRSASVGNYVWEKIETANQIASLTEQIEDIREMANNNHYKAFLSADESSIIADLDGTPLLADWKYQII